MREGAKRKIFRMFATVAGQAPAATVLQLPAQPAGFVHDGLRIASQEITVLAMLEAQSPAADVRIAQERRPV
jgi:hypothetical protein